MNKPIYGEHSIKIPGLNDNDYIDEYGLVHPTSLEKTDFGIIYRAMLDNFCKLNGSDFYPGFMTAVSSVAISNKQFNSFPGEPAGYFSSDNMLGLYCVCKIHNMRLTIKQLPLIKWNNSYNFRNFFILLAIKYPVLKYNPILILTALLDLISGEYKKTGAKNIWFLVLNILNLKWPLKLAGLYYKLCYPTRRWAVFQHSHEYRLSSGFSFFNPGNPIIKEMRKYYKHG